MVHKAWAPVDPDDKGPRSTAARREESSQEGSYAARLGARVLGLVAFPQAITRLAPVRSRGPAEKPQLPGTPGSERGNPQADLGPCRAQRYSL